MNPRLEDITECELFSKNTASFNEALKHYNGDFKKEYAIYSDVLKLKEFPSFEQYFILVYVPMLHGVNDDRRT